ncbi:MAG TPA: glucose 1-dehydrogenase [Casimicrobiaceae bacterium]
MPSVQELFSLKGRVAIVTGASRGLGKEAAEALAEAGASVVLAARRAQWLEPAAQEFKARGFDCLACSCDVSDEAQVSNVAAQALERFGRIDILINNAGISWAAPFEEATIESWNKVLATNVIGTQMMTRAVLPAMRKQGYGKIVNIASVMGLIGAPRDILEATSYTASKGAILAMTRELAVNYAAQGIRVNAIAPGFFPTRLASAVIDRAGERIRELTPLGRVGAEGELKGAILFLSAPASDYITGQTIAIDGGMTAG